MPVLIDSVSENLHKLLKNGGLASITLLREFGRIVEMTIDISFVLVVRILSSKDCRAHGAGEVLNVILAIQCSDI